MASRKTDEPRDRVGIVTERRRKPSTSTDGVPRAKKLRTQSLRGSVYSTVGFDAKGNAILEWRAQLPARRADDETLNYLKCLENENLEIAEDGDLSGDAQKALDGYNPYNKPK